MSQTGVSLRIDLGLAVIQTECTSGHVRAIIQIECMDAIHSCHHWRASQPLQRSRLCYYRNVAVLFVSTSTRYAGECQQVKGVRSMVAYMYRIILKSILEVASCKL